MYVADDTIGSTSMSSKRSKSDWFESSMALLRQPWSRRTWLLVLLVILLGHAFSGEYRMLLLLHVSLPCLRWLPSLQFDLFRGLESYLYFELAWSPRSFRPEELPEISYDDYSGLQQLKRLSQWGRSPVIIRGLMNNSIESLQTVETSLYMDPLQASCVSLRVNGEGAEYHSEDYEKLMTAHQGTQVLELIHYRFSIFLAPRNPPSGQSGYLTTSHPILDKMLELIPKTQVTLEPGDVLYSPPWHWLRLKEAPKTMMSSCRWLDSRTAARLSDALMLYKSAGWDLLLHPLYPRWLRDSIAERHLVPAFSEPGYVEGLLQ